MKLPPFLLLLVALVSSSCVISFYPMAEHEDEYHFNPGLYGRWTDTSANVEAFFDTTGTSDERYSVTFVVHEVIDRQVQDTSYFEAFIVKSGGKNFLNAYIDRNHHQFVKVGTAAVELIPETYLILKLEVNNGKMILSIIDEKVLDKLIEKKQFNVKYSSKGSEKILLTEEPKQLKLKSMN